MVFIIAALSILARVTYEVLALAPSSHQLGAFSGLCSADGYYSVVPTHKSIPGTRYVLLIVLIIVFFVLSNGTPEENSRI